MSERFYSSNEEQQGLPQLKLHEPLPTAILAFFFTPLLGAIMISSNWKKLNKPESASRTMMIFYAYLVVLIGSYFAPPIAIFPIIIILLLIIFWFNVHHQSKHLSENNITYTPQSIAKPIVCGLCIIIVSYSLTIYSKWDYLKAEFSKVEQILKQVQQQQFTKADLAKLKQRAAMDVAKLYSETGDGSRTVNFELIKNPKNIGEKMTNVLRIRYKEIIDLDNGYDRDLNEIGFYSLMDPERIKKPNAIKETEKMLSSGIKTATNYKDLNLESYERSITSIANLSNGLDSETKLKGDNNRKALFDLWDLEIKIIKKMGEMTIHLHQCSEKWEYEEDGYVFTNDNDLEKFKLLSSEFDALSTQQDKANAKMENEMQSE